MYHNLSSDEILVSTSKKKKIENCRSYMVPLMHESREILTILSASAQKSNPKEGSFSILVTSSSWYYFYYYNSSLACFLTQKSQNPLSVRYG